ncbi:MAG: bifunctional 3'-5' exonuclease/DNA polymerase [Micrococcus sp.]|nr:bifunctional 3'-5' exonuclease/DNA polymerase [Micrococcus sp.]
MHLVLGPAPRSADRPAGTWWAVPDDDTSVTTPLAEFVLAEVADVVLALPQRLGVEPERVRWCAASLEELSRPCLTAGVRLARGWDLALCQRILRTAASSESAGLTYAPTVELAVADPAAVPASPIRRVPEGQEAFFDVAAADEPELPDVHQLRTELHAQLAAVAASAHPPRLTLLLAAESQGALIAEEIHAAGLPWDAQLHARLLEQRLGPRPQEGKRPARLQELADQLARQLGVSEVNPDSPPSVLRALHQAGVTVESTRQWDLQAWVEAGGTEREQRAALIEPLLQYKKLSRLFTANGWHWLDAWVQDRRFHARYLVGGVVTGRWSAHGGGAMQIPAGVREAVTADPGWLLTVADASQVEPRILAAMSQDVALAAAGSTPDLYTEVAEQGRAAGTSLADRSRAKVALLGAMYGATTGDSAALLPHLRRLYPHALELLETAAAAGERGGQVSTWLGRVSPAPTQAWRDTVQRQSSQAEESRARQLRRAAGRFTRNFVVQGTAAEWALCWMGEIRRRLVQQGCTTALVFFVHDEVVLHGPAAEAEQVRAVVAESASAAGRLLFGAAPVDFPLTVSSVECYADAK